MADVPADCLPWLAEALVDQRITVEGRALTVRQFQVWWLERQGLTTKQIARRLFITATTVRTHRMAMKRAGLA